MRAGQRNRDRVGDIVRLGQRAQAERERDGPLHLRLAGVSAASKEFLYVRGRNAHDRQPPPSRERENDAARVPHENRGARMFVMSVKLLARQHCRTMLFEQSGEGRFRVRSVAAPKPPRVEAESLQLRRVAAQAIKHAWSVSSAAPNGIDAQHQRASAAKPFLFRGTHVTCMMRAAGLRSSGQRVRSGIARWRTAVAGSSLR